MKLGEKIKLLRTENNWTQPELARQAGIEQSYLSKLENDKGSPSFEVINKVARAFEMSGMELIQTLSQSYIEESLSHIPEIAAEYASVRKKKERVLKQKLFLASFLIVIGVGISLAGYKNLLFPELAYNYFSSGVIREGESIFQFQDHPIEEISETADEAKSRMRANKSRLEPRYKILYDQNIDQFIEEVPGGQRLYVSEGYVRFHHSVNDLIFILGVMMFSAGLSVIFVAVIHFRVTNRVAS